MARSLGVLTVDLVLKLGGFTQGADRAAREAKRLEAQLKGTFTTIGRGFDRLNAVLGTFGVAFSAGLVVSELTQAAKAAIDFGDSIEKAMAATGVGAEPLQELAFAAQQTDVDFQTLSTSLFRMQKAISEAASGSNKALIKTFDELGLNLKELQQLDAADQFEAIAGALAEFSDEGARAALGADVFGKGVLTLLPLLAQGAEGVRAFREEAHDLGLVLDPETIKALAEAEQATKRLDAAMTGASRAATGFIAVPLTDFLNGITLALTNQEPIWQNLIDSADDYFKALISSRGNPILFFGQLADQIRIAGAEQRELNAQTKQFGSLAETLGFAAPTKTRNTITDEDRKAIEKFAEAAKSSVVKVAEFRAELERLAALDPKKLTPEVVAKAVEDFAKGLEKAGERAKKAADPAPFLQDLAINVSRATVSATEQLFRDMDAATQTAQEKTLAEFATFQTQLAELVAAGRITAEQATEREIEIRINLDVDGFRKQAEAFSDEVDQIRTEFARREQTVDVRVQTGNVSEIGGRRELIRTHQEEAAELQKVVDKYKAIAQAARDAKQPIPEMEEEIRRVEEAIEDLKTTTDEFGKIAADAFETGLSDALADVAKGVKSLGEAAEDFLDSITDSLLDWAAEQVAAQMRDIIFGGLQGGFAGGLFGGGAGGGAALAPLSLTAARLPEPTGLSEIAVTAQRLPEVGAESAEAAALTAAATALTTAGTTLTTGATTFVTGTTTLATAATGLLTAAGALSAAATTLAASGASGGLEEIIITTARLAEGGKVSGPGGIDRVPAMLTAGEFVVNAQAVQRPGVQQLLERINDGGGVFRHFAEGGSVERGSPGATSRETLREYHDAQAREFHSLRESSRSKDRERLVESSERTSSTAFLRHTEASRTDRERQLIERRLTDRRMVERLAMVIRGAPSATMLARFIEDDRLHRAEGGPVFGPAGIDRVPAMLTAGEFVVKAEAVRQPGVQRVLERINAGTVHHFVEGGLVAPQLARYADGGMVRAVPDAATGRLTLMIPQPTTSQRESSTIVNQAFNFPNASNISKQTELQLTAAAARGVRTADRRNN